MSCSQAFAVLALALFQGEQTQDSLGISATVPEMRIGQSALFVFPRFDPETGVLRNPAYSSTVGVSGRWSVENTDGQAVVIGLPNHYVGLAVSRSALTGPAGPLVHTGVFRPPQTVLLAAFDGVLDFAGPSSHTWTFPAGPGPITGQFFGIGDFVGTGTAIAQVFTVTNRVVSPHLPSTVRSELGLRATVTATLRYFYDQPPTRICQVWGTGLCPCYSPGAATSTGCPNSVSTSNFGAVLEVAGISSLSADTLELIGAWMPDSSAMYFQGASFTYGGIPFGDGYRCVTGVIRRLGMQTNAGGSSRYPMPGDAPISVRGAIQAPGLRYYQIVYRDPAVGFCTPADFNATSGVAVRWFP